MIYLDINFMGLLKRAVNYSCSASAITALAFVIVAIANAAEPRTTAPHFAALSAQFLADLITLLLYLTLVLCALLSEFAVYLSIDRNLGMCYTFTGKAIVHLIFFLSMDHPLTSTSSSKYDFLPVSYFEFFPLCALLSSIVARIALGTNSSPRTLTSAGW
jgi:hypothetical protein